jgi:hypothetical protein
MIDPRDWTRLRGCPPPGGASGSPKEDAMNRPLARSAAPAALLAALAGIGGAPGGVPLRAAAAALPVGVPVFSNPLDFDNEHFPCVPGAFKVYAGREGADPLTVVEMHLPETRTFDWKGTPVECRTIRESTFEEGAYSEISTAWFAQADDGSVYAFGEVSIENPQGEPPDDPQDEEDYGWVVGALAPGDPEGTAVSADPFLFMPASPAVGDSWKPEDLPPVVDETVEVVRAGVRRFVRAGRFPDCIAVRERSGKHPGSEMKWYAPRIGLVEGRGRTERIALRATTLPRR